MAETKNTIQDVKNLMFGRAVDDFKCYKTLYMKAKAQLKNDSLVIKRLASDKMYLCAYNLSNLFNINIQDAYELLENYIA